ncbi:hypothetical protein [Microcystis phage MinS1]|nr:hypothetical protein [Microcystis phage MinS1]
MSDPTPADMVRFLVNDVRLADVTGNVFSDAEISTYLALEGGNVKRAAAQVLDTIADNEALASKAIRTQDVATDGAKIADSLRKRAAELRRQADEADADEGFFFDVIDLDAHSAVPEVTQMPWWA